MRSRGPSPFVHVGAPVRDRKAAWALGLGIASLLGLGPFTGVPAIALGAIARRDVDRSGGRLHGAGLAAGGIVTGLFGTGLAVVVALGLASGAFEARHGEATARAAKEPAPGGATTGANAGAIEVVDLASADAGGPLPELLTTIAAAARAEDRTLLLLTHVRRSRACAEVAAALPNARMQAALAKVTLVRVDVERFRDELEAMRVDTRAAPIFYRLDALGRPGAALAADAWGANVPENMAPVLGAFVRDGARPGL